MHKIVLLDSRTLGEDFEAFELNELGNVTKYGMTLPHEVEERIKDCDIVLTNKVVLNESNLKNATELKFIGIVATGTNNVDLDYCRSKSIAVTNVAGYSTGSVAQHTFAMLLYLLENLSYYDDYVKSKQYSQSLLFTHLGKEYYELEGKTWGIIGLGTIGKRVAGIAEAFGCRIIYYSPSGINNFPIYKKVDLDELLEKSDIVSIHSPLNEKTKGLLGIEELKKMKQSAILINAGRGGIVKEKDLAKALKENIIKAAALDVLEHEPIKESNPLLEIQDKGKLLITPHIAWGSMEARERLIQEMILNIKYFDIGEIRNRVD